jgi:hypothetical protein
MGKSQPALNYKIESVEYDVTRYPILGGGGVEESYLGASGDIVIKNIILGNLPEKRELTVNFELFDLNAETSTTPKLRGTDIPIVTVGKRGKTNNKINVETRATTKEVRRYFAGEDGGLDVQIRVFELINVGSARMAVFEETNEIFFTLNIDLPGVNIVQEVQEEEEVIVQEVPEPQPPSSTSTVQKRIGRSVVTKSTDDKPTVQRRLHRATEDPEEEDKPTVQKRLHRATEDPEEEDKPTVQKRLYTGDKTAQVEEEEKEEIKVVISDPVDSITPQDLPVVHTPQDLPVERDGKVYRSEPLPVDPIVPSGTRNVNVPSESDKIALQVALNEAKRSKALNEAIEQLRVGAQDQINDLAGYSREDRIRLSDIIIQTVDETIVQLQQEYNDDRQEDTNLLFEVSINETSDTTVLSGTLPPGFVYINPSLPLQESFTPVFGDLELPTEQSIELVTDDQIGVTEVDEQLDKISEEARLAQKLCDTEEDCDTLNY